MKTQNELRQILKSHQEELNKKYGVTEIGFFGSYLRDEQKERSDVDILVEFNKAVDLLTFVNLKNHLSDLLRLDVDLVMRKALKPKIGKKILKEVKYI